MYRPKSDGAGYSSQKKSGDLSKIWNLFFGGSLLLWFLWDTLFTWFLPRDTFIAQSPQPNKPLKAGPQDVRTGVAASRRILTAGLIPANLCAYKTFEALLRQNVVKGECMAKKVPLSARVQTARQPQYFFIFIEVTHPRKSRAAAPIFRVSFAGNASPSACKIAAPSRCKRLGLSQRIGEAKWVDREN